MCASGHIGNLNWQVNGDAVISSASSLIAFYPDHQGILNITTASQILGTFGYILLDNSALAGRPLLANSFDTIQFIAAFEDPTETGDGIAFGAMKDFGVDGTAEGMYFSFEYGDTNWQAVTCDDIGTTKTDTGIAFVDSDWYLFEIKRTAVGEYTFYINRVSVAVNTINITDEPLAVMFGLSAVTIGSFNILIDYFGLQLTAVTQRWT